MVDDPTRLTVTPAPPVIAPLIEKRVTVALKFTLLTADPFTVTLWLAGLTAKPAPAGVTVYAPLGTVGNMKFPEESATVVCVVVPDNATVIPGALLTVPETG